MPIHMISCNFEFETKGVVQAVLTVSNYSCSADFTSNPEGRLSAAMTSLCICADTDVQ